MPRYNNSRYPQGNTWFDWLPHKVQCFPLLCITVPLSAGSFVAGMHFWHAGHPFVMTAGTSIEVSEFFLASLVSFFLSACLFAIMMGWAKPGPHISETHHPRQ